MDKLPPITYPVQLHGFKIGVTPKAVTDLEMLRLRLLAGNPAHPHARLLFSAERNKDKRR